MRMLETYSDTELIAAVKSGNQRAFGEIVRRYEGIVASTTISMLGPSSEAEDAGQETMIKLYKSLDRFKGQSKLSTYVTRIAINTSLDSLRRRKKQVSRFFSMTDDESTKWDNYIASDSDQGRDFELKQAIGKAMASLKPEFRAVAVSRLIQGFSTREVAVMLGIETGTVLSRLSRAKAQLADGLREDFRND